jgi:hypothetical protein
MDAVVGIVLARGYGFDDFSPPLASKRYAVV